MIKLNEVYVLYCRWMNDSRRWVVAMYGEWAAGEENLKLKLSYEELKNNFLKTHTTDTWTQFKKRWNRLPEENKCTLRLEYHMGYDFACFTAPPLIINAVRKHCLGEDVDIFN